MKRRDPNANPEAYVCRCPEFGDTLCRDRDSHNRKMIEKFGPRNDFTYRPGESTGSELTEQIRRRYDEIVATRTLPTRTPPTS